MKHKQTDTQKQTGKKKQTSHTVHKTRIKVHAPKKDYNNLAVNVSACGKGP